VRTSVPADRCTDPLERRGSTCTDTPRRKQFHARARRSSTTCTQGGRSSPRPSVSDRELPRDKPQDQPLLWLLREGGYSCQAAYGKDFGALPLKMLAHTKEGSNPRTATYLVKLSQSLVDAYKKLLEAEDVFIPLPKLLTEERPLSRKVLNASVTVNEKDHGTEFDEQQARKIHAIQKNSKLAFQAIQLRIKPGNAVRDFSKECSVANAELKIPLRVDDSGMWADIKQWMLARARSIFKDGDDDPVLAGFVDDFAMELLQVRLGNTGKWVHLYEAEEAVHA